MTKIPKAEENKTHSKIRFAYIADGENDKIVFSFKSVSRNEFFNLDSTCSNWANELFEIMKFVSDISVKEVYAGKYSGKGSPFRIHQHINASPPCKTPSSVNIEDMWQIRISKSKGGIHGVFCENIFYVIWFDPHHNLYPDERYGGIKKINPPVSCCKDREEQISDLYDKLDKEKQNSKFWKDFAEDCIRGIGDNNE